MTCVTSGSTSSPSSYCSARASPHTHSKANGPASITGPFILRTTRLLKRQANRLASRSGATVLFAWCERIGPGPGHALRIMAASPGIGSADAQVATAALNADVERIARRDPAQYQWTYKRFKAQPAGAAVPNPYADLEGG